MATRLLPPQRRVLLGVWRLPARSGRNQHLRGRVDGAPHVLSDPGVSARRLRQGGRNPHWRFSVFGALVGTQHSRCVGRPLHGGARPVRHAPVQEIPAVSPLDFRRGLARPGSTQGLHGVPRRLGARDRKSDRGPSGTYVGDDVVRDHGRAGVDLLRGSGWPVLGHTPRGTSRDGAGSADWTTAGCRLCLRRGSGDPYHRRGSRIHTDRRLLLTFRALSVGYRNHASGGGEVGDAPLVSSFSAVDPRVPNLPPRSRGDVILSGVRASGRRVELCPGGGKLRHGLSTSGPDHAALLCFFGRRPLLDQGHDHQPDAVVAD